MQPYQKFIRKLHLCAGCDKKETGCTRTSAADTLDLRESVMVSIGVTKLGPMDLIYIDARVKINGTYNSEVLHVWDLWRVLYLPARQCACSPCMRDNQPSETRHLRSFQQAFCHPTAQIWTRVDYKSMWINAAEGLASSWCRWTEAVLNRCLASFWTKHHRWRSWSVAQCAWICVKKDPLSI